MSFPVPVFLSLPWVVLPVATVIRARQSRSLSEESLDVPALAPTLSIVIPARNEEHNIERCVRSALASSYPQLDVVVVNEHSTGGTAAILARIANGNERLWATPSVRHDAFARYVWRRFRRARDADARGVTPSRSLDSGYLIQSTGCRTG